MFLFFLSVVGAVVAVVHPKTPLQPEWNPLMPLQIADDVTPLTRWKMSQALASRDVCVAALETGAVFDALPDFEESAQCNIHQQVRLRNAGAATLSPINTRCQTALRVAMWERHGIQPAASRHLNAEVREILHFSSYNCRQIRTGSVGSQRMSTHATADAIDISGFVLSDGSRVRLLDDWNGTPGRAAFLRDVRDSACAWFRVTLSPDYNDLHADHFHLQHTGYGLCR